MKSSASKQVMIETSRTLMMVDMNVVIVVLIALLRYLLGIFKTIVCVLYFGEPSFSHCFYASPKDTRLNILAITTE